MDVKWQPIETAPKDGTAFLAAAIYVLMPPIIVVVHYSEDGRLLVSWDHDDQFSPSFWMPLPPPPET